MQYFAAGQVFWVTAILVLRTSEYQRLFSILRQIKMDPLSALSLTSNVVQLVDAASKAFTICHEIYRLGSSIEDSRMLYTSSQLYQCYSGLNESLKNGTGARAKILQNGVDLVDLGSQCCETARILHSELESLRKSPGGGFRETISTAIARRKKSKKIDKLKGRLDEYQKVLDSRVLVNIRHVNSYPFRILMLIWSVKSRSCYL